MSDVFTNQEVLVAHANARLNKHGRRLLVSRVIDEGRPVAHVAKELGVSRQCAHRGVARFRAEEEVGLAHRSARPHRCPRRTTARVEQRVLELRRQERRGHDWIGPELGLAPRGPGIDARASERGNIARPAGHRGGVVAMPEALVIARSSRARRGLMFTSFATVGADRHEGSDWARFDSQTPATACQRSQRFREASLQVRSHFGLTVEASRKALHPRSAPLMCSR